MDTTRANYPFEPTWESLRQYAPPDWYTEGKFGIFVHWGIYSVPAYHTEWYGRSMYLTDHQVFRHHQEKWGAGFGYKDFIPLFRGEQFNPEDWADLFQRAGARYVVPVAEHHDGFAMYDTALSEWNAVRMGPQRDVIGELASAVRKRGLVFGVSSHRAEHWWFFNGGRDFDSDVQDARYAGLYGPAVAQGSSSKQARRRARLRNRLIRLGISTLGRVGVEVRRPSGMLHDSKPRPDAKFLDDWLARCCELVDQYQPQLIYFDWWIDQIVFQPYLQKFSAYYYYNRAQSWGQGAVINYKYESFPSGTAVRDIEHASLSAIQPHVWQTDTSVSTQSWSYVENDTYKTAGELVHTLVDVVSKNGNLLLNVGPKADGTLPGEVRRALLGLGDWLRINGEAIYGSRPWRTFGEGARRRASRVEVADNQHYSQLFSASDIRFTARDGVVYALCLGWPGEVALIRSLATEKIERIEMLGSEQTLTWSQGADGLKISTPAQRPCDDAFTFKITLKPD